MLIDKKDRTSREKKLISIPFVKKPIAINRNDAQCNDLMSWGNDILMATCCDIVRFPGGSGNVTWIKDKLNSPTSHCFEVFPRSGFALDTGEPLHDIITNRPDILLMTGSGALFQIPLASGADYNPSGVELVFNLATEFYKDFNTLEINRRTGNTFNRILNSYNQPMRTCYIKN